MNNIRIVCTLDAVKTAQALMRMLAAEGYNLDLSYGRGSLEQLEDAISARETVLLIWSFDAPSAQHMLHWQKAIDPNFLVEIARAPGAPVLPKRRASVIDFSAWSGERGGAAWRGLQDRLRQVDRVAEPPRPLPLRPIAALAAASAVGVVGAAFVRAGDDAAPMATAQKDAITNYDIEVGLGGPLRSEEPASQDDADLSFGPLVRRAEAIPAMSDGVALSPAPIADPLHAREAQLLDRLTEFAQPLIDEIRR